MPNHVEHRAFTIAYEGLTDEISTPVRLESICTTDYWHGYYHNGRLGSL
jgi:hypothetical protein